MSGSSDYTSLRKFKHLFPPGCNSGGDNYEVIIPGNQTRCNDNHNKVNYIYVMPNHEKPCYHHSHEDNSCNRCVVKCEKGSKGEKGEQGIPGQPGDKITSNSKTRYIITPSDGGSVTFTVDRGLIYTSGNNIFCTNNESSQNYFEGTIYNYNTTTGEITIYQIHNINGTFTQPAEYNIILLAGSQEIVKLRTRVNELYKLLFQVDLTKYENNDYDLILTNYNNEINLLYKYFFDIDIVDYYDDYELSEPFLNKRINFLYYEFFDISGSVMDKKPMRINPNPNKNGVLVNTLQNKISQLYVYFFNQDLAIKLSFTPFIN